MSLFLLLVVIVIGTYWFVSHAYSVVVPVGFRNIRVTVLSQIPKLYISPFTLNEKILEIVLNQNQNIGPGQFYSQDQNILVTPSAITISYIPISRFHGKYSTNNIRSAGHKVSLETSSYDTKTKTLALTIYYDLSIFKYRSQTEIIQTFSDSAYLIFYFIKGIPTTLDSPSQIHAVINTHGSRETNLFSIFIFPWEKIVSFFQIPKAYASCGGGYDCGNKSSTCTCSTDSSTCGSQGTQCGSDPYNPGTCNCTTTCVDSGLTRACNNLNQTQCVSCTYPGCPGLACGAGSDCIPSAACSWTAPPPNTYTCYECSGSTCTSYTSTDSTCGGTNCNSCSGPLPTPTPTPTSGCSGCGGCGDSCSSDSNCVPGSGLVCSGGKCTAQYCSGPIPSNSITAYAYCQDPGGPPYPLPNLLIGLDENGGTSHNQYTASDGTTYFAPLDYTKAYWSLIREVSLMRIVNPSDPTTQYGLTTDPLYTDHGGNVYGRVLHPLQCFTAKNATNDGGDASCTYGDLTIPATGQPYKYLVPGYSTTTAPITSNVLANYDGSLGGKMGWSLPGDGCGPGYAHVCNWFLGGPRFDWSGSNYTYNGNLYAGGSYPYGSYADETAAGWYWFNDSHTVTPLTAALSTGYSFSDGNGGIGLWFHFSNCQLCVSPGAITGLTPSNGAILTETTLPVSIQVSWTKEPNSSGYDIEVYPTGTSCSDPNAHCSYYSLDPTQGSTVPAYTFSANQKAWTYRVRGIGGCTPTTGSKIGPWSPFTSFTLQANISGTVEYIPDPNEAIVNVATSTCYNPNNGPETPTQPGAGSTVTFNNSATGPESSWIPISGDWNGTGTTYVGLYDPATSTFHLKTSDVSGAGDINFVFGNAGTAYIPITGDWTGIGHTGVGLYNPANGAWFLKNNNSTGNADISFTYGPGNQGWFPITGDWTGIGHTGVGLYNPANSNFYLKNDNTTGFADAQFQFGNPYVTTYIPVSGNWSGSGKTTIGLYEGLNAEFFLRNTNTAGNADEVFVYGNANGGYSTVLSGKWAGGTSSGVGLYIPDTTQFLLRNELSTGFADETFNYNASNGLSTANVNADGTFASIMLPYNTGTLSTLHITNPKYVCTCPADCSYGLYPPNATVKYFISSNGLAWWQAQGGDVGSMAKDGHVVYDPISQLCQPPFCSPTLTSPLTPADVTDFTAGSLTTAGSDGSTTFPTVQTQELGGYSSTPGNIASPPSSSFYAPSYPRIPPTCRENYQFFYRLYSLGLNPQDDFSQQGNLRTDALLPYNPPLSSTGAYYTKGDMTINQPWVVPDNSTYVIFVDGKLTINNTITVPTDSFLAFITSDNIIVTPTVGTPTFTSPGPGQVQGLYVTNGTFTVQSAGSSGTDIKFIGEGSFAACQGINLQRDFNHGGHGDQNNENPADLFIYRPDLVKNVPKQMTHYHIDWHEVAP